MKFIFIFSAVLTALTLAASMLFWSVHAATGEHTARQRAVGFFRWTVVVVLTTFNLWIFNLVGGAIKDMWFPPPPPPKPALIDGQLPGRPPPEEASPQN